MSGPGRGHRLNRPTARRRPGTAGRSFVVVTYDISDDKRRTKVAEILLGFGARIQGSVYELWLDERQTERMWAKVEAAVVPGDLVRCYLLCAACRPRTRSYGQTTPEINEVFIV